MEKQFIIDCINQHRGDDLVRTKAAFKNLSPEEMQEHWGLSSQTRQQVLTGLLLREKRCNDAIAAINNL